MINLTGLRLANQHIENPALARPEDAVESFGGMQAQDYPGALYSIGLRTNSSLAEVEKAIAEKRIIRTWAMRGTLHFLDPRDIKWILSLLAPKIIAGMAGRNRQLGLYAGDFEKSQRLFSKILKGNNFLTRGEIYAELEQDGISTKNQRGIHLLWQAALDQVICFGPHRDKKPTFALLGEVVSSIPRFERTGALERLMETYFRSHGPATVRDYSWWSGLGMNEIRQSLKKIEKKLRFEIMQGQTYWMPKSAPAKSSSQTAYLLPGFDEYMLGYKDRSAVIDSKLSKLIVPGNGMFSPIIILDGRAIGIWKRSIKKTRIQVQTKIYTNITAPQKKAILCAAECYGRFMGLPIETN